MLDTISRDVEFYLPIGTPEGVDLFAGDGIVVSPKLISVSPQIGSPSSSLIVVKVQGVGKQTKGITLINPSNQGAALCSSLSIVRYGEVECRTVRGVISTPVSISVKNGNSVITCQSQDACNYQTDSNMPNIIQAEASSDTTIVMNGANFDYFASGFSPSVTLGGIPATSVTIGGSPL